MQFKKYNSVLFLNRLPAVDNSLGPPSVVMKLDVEGRFELQHLAKMMIIVVILILLMNLSLNHV